MTILGIELLHAFAGSASERSGFFVCEVTDFNVVGLIERMADDVFSTHELYINLVKFSQMPVSSANNWRLQVVEQIDQVDVLVRIKLKQRKIQAEVLKGSWEQLPPRDYQWLLNYDDFVAINELETLYVQFADGSYEATSFAHFQAFAHQGVFHRKTIAFIGVQSLSLRASAQREHLSLQDPTRSLSDHDEIRARVTPAEPSRKEKAKARFWVILFFVSIPVVFILSFEVLGNRVMWSFISAVVISSFYVFVVSLLNGSWSRMRRLLRK